VQQVPGQESGPLSVSVPRPKIAPELQHTHTKKKKTNHDTVGDKYPKTKIVGLDLSPIQPDFVPENVHFFIDDFEEEWLDPAHKYDYIHVRHTLHSIRDRKALYRRAMQ